MNELDEQALEYSMFNAVEFLNEAGTTDLKALSVEELYEFMRVVICRYQDKAQR